MKKGILAILSILFLMVSVQGALAYNDFTLTLNAANSGATTTSSQTTGTSTFIINGKAASTYIDMDQVGAPYLGVKITGLSPYQAGTANYSGNTFQVLYSTSQDASDLSTQEKIPIWYNDACNSSTTPYERVIQIPFSRYVQFYLRPSGVTPYDSASLKVYAGKDAAWLPPSPLLLGTLVFTGPTSSGGSSFASADSNGTIMPDGTRRLEAMATASGVSVIYSTSTPNSAGQSQHIPGETEKTFTGPLQTLKNYWIRILGAGNAVVECWNREAD